MSRTKKIAISSVIIVSAIFVFIAPENGESAVRTVRPVYTVGMSAGAKSWVSLGRWVPTNMRWGTFSLDFEYGAEYNGRFRVSAKTRVTTFSFPDYVNLYLLDASLNLSYNITDLFDDNYLYCSGGFGLGIINEGNIVVSENFPIGILSVGLGVRSVGTPSIFFELMLWHASAMPIIDNDGGINSLVVRAGFEFGKTIYRRKEGKFVREQM